MDCIDIGCNKLDGRMRCMTYGLKGQLFRIRMGYCPIADKYFNADKQANYESSKQTKKAVSKQQKQRRH